jgi:hypothetical protein
MSEWEGEICKRCNQEQRKIWRTTDEQWNSIVAGRWNVLCIDCFDELAGELFLYWECAWKDYPTNKDPKGLLISSQDCYYLKHILQSTTHHPFAPLVDDLLARIDELHGV